MASLSSLHAPIRLVMIVVCLAMPIQTALAQERTVLIEGKQQQANFGQIVECLTALSKIGVCGPDIIRILQGHQKVNQISLSKDCCGAILNIAAQCDLAKLQIDPRITGSILEACARGAADPPAQAFEDKSTIDEDLSWPTLF